MQRHPLVLRLTSRSAVPGELYKSESGAFNPQPQKICKEGGKLPPSNGRPRKSVPPKQLFLEPERKRKAPVGISSLAMTWVGPSSPEPKKLKPWSPLTQSN